MEISQIPGTLKRSHPVLGVAETGLKSKRYLLSLSIIQPEVIIGCGIAYLNRGSWKVGVGATPVQPDIWVLQERRESQGNESVAGGAAASSNTGSFMNNP
jgi:hypothetical protein